MLSALFTVWLLHILATAAPGANAFLVMQLAASQQRNVALRAAAGVAVGSAVWAALAVLGINAVFTTFPTIRFALQLAGGFYLLWLAAKFCFSTPIGVARESHTPGSSRAFRLGVLTNLTNPKAALFFGSIFSAALPAYPPAWLMFTVVAVVFANSLSWYSFVAYLFSRKSVRSYYFANARAVERVAGLILGGFGVRLLFQSFNEART